MIKKIGSLSRWMLLAAATLFFAAPAFADTITFSVINSSQTATAGSTVNFSGTVSVFGNSSPVYLDDTFTFNSLTSLSDQGYFDNVYPVSFVSGQNVFSPMFSLTLPANLAAGIYSGTFTLYEDNDPTVYSTQNYQVTILGASPVPEPSSWILLITGLAIGGAILYQNKHSRTASPLA